MNDSIAGAKTVMVVDDDESVRSFLSFSLKGEGFNVLEARDPVEAQRVVEKKIPDLMLLDIMLPGMDGFSLCAKLRADARFHKMPILFITAYADQHSLGKAADVGAQGLIEKPIMFGELLMQIVDAFAGRFSLPTRLKYSSD